MDLCINIISFLLDVLTCEANLGARKFSGFFHQVALYLLFKHIKLDIVLLFEVLIVKQRLFGINLLQNLGSFSIMRSNFATDFVNLFVDGNQFL